jgi:type IV secretion system protein VirB3
MNDGDPIFKGCTRPSMIFGVPLVPLTVAMLPVLLIGIWGMWLAPVVGLSALVLMVPIFIILRWITKKDDQRLLQHLLRLKMRYKQRNLKHWVSASYSPIEYKKKWNFD